MKLYECGNLEKVGTYTLSNRYYDPAEDGTPNTCLSIPLQPGDYAFVYEDGGLVSRKTKKINGCFRATQKEKISLEAYSFETSTENIDWDDDEQVEQFYLSALVDGNGPKKSCEFSCDSETVICIWENEEPEYCIGSLKFSIYRVKDRLVEPTIEENMVSDLQTGFTLSTNLSKIYEVVVYEKSESQKIPRAKYPSGVFQLVAFDELATIGTHTDIDLIKEQDHARMEFDENKKLISLNGVDIPSDINPLKYYIVIGKVELLITIDYLADDYIIQPVGPAQAYLNLFIPKRTEKLVEATDTHATYLVTDFVLVSNNFKDVKSIKDGICRWLQCEREDIYNDEYELFFYVSSFNLYDWYCERFKSFIDSHFIALNLWKIKATAYDDVTVREVESPLDYSITECKWKIEDSIPTTMNKLSWSYENLWEPTTEENKVKFTSTGKGFVRISKKHFMDITRLTESEIASNKFGKFTDEEFKALNLNGPKISPFNRLDSWMNLQI